MSHRIGVDVGGTKCHAVLLGDDGSVQAELRRPTPATADELVDVVTEMFVALGRSEHLGIGLPGLVTRSGILRVSPNLPQMVEVPFAELLLRRLGTSTTVRIDNDATCAACAEWRLGAGQGIDDLVLVTLGTGIGGGIVAGGHLQRGAHGYAGEIGHLCLVTDGRLCGCGRRGCWERYASGSSLAEHARQRLGVAVSPESVVAAARLDEPWAHEVFADFVQWLALGMATLANILDPQRFVLGGGLVDSADVFLEPLRSAYPNYLYHADHRDHAEIVVASLGPRAGALGAALLDDFD